MGLDVDVDPIRQDDPHTGGISLAHNDKNHTFSWLKGEPGGLFYLCNIL